MFVSGRVLESADFFGLSVGDAVWVREEHAGDEFWSEGHVTVVEMEPSGLGRAVRVSVRTAFGQVVRGPWRFDSPAALDARFPVGDRRRGADRSRALVNQGARWLAVPAGEADGAEVLRLTPLYGSEASIRVTAAGVAPEALVEALEGLLGGVEGVSVVRVQGRYVPDFRVTVFPKGEPGSPVAVGVLRSDMAVYCDESTDFVEVPVSEPAREPVSG